MEPNRYVIFLIQRSLIQEHKNQKAKAQICDGSKI